MIDSKCKLSSYGRPALEIMLGSGNIHALELSFRSFWKFVPKCSINICCIIALQHEFTNGGTCTPVYKISSCNM